MKILKLFAACTAAVALMTGIASCGSKNSGENTDGEKTELSTEQQRKMEVLEKEVENVNKQLPMEQGNGLKLTKMEIKDGYMVSYATYPQDADLEVSDSPETRQAIVESAGESAISRLKALNLGLKYVYTEEGTDSTTTITVSPEEM